MAKPKHCAETLDLFETSFLDRRPSMGGTLAGLDAQFRQSMSQALKEHPQSREIVAAEMSRLLSDETLSVAMLNAYTAESQTSHRISVVRFIALVRATGATWLLDLIADQCGCTVLEGEEAVLAQRGLVRQQLERLQQIDRELAKRAPVKVARRRA